MGRIMFKVRPFEAKTRLFKFDHEWMNTFELVQCSKNYVRVCLMSNLVNLTIALLGSMFIPLKPKIGCSSSITNRWTCSCSFDVRKMMFEFVRCSIKWCFILVLVISCQEMSLFLALLRKNPLKYFLANASLF